MADAPEKIWAATVTDNYGEWQTSPNGLPRPTEYTRSDLVAELAAENEWLKAKFGVCMLVIEQQDRHAEALSRTGAPESQHPVAHAYVIDGECEQIEWGLDVDLPDDSSLVLLYAHPTVETKACCCDRCNAVITEDVSVPDDVWGRISPKPIEGFKGGGLLCAQCIVNALTCSSVVTEVMVEAGARAIAEAWDEEWECCCTERKGLNCDCGGAMTDERSDSYDERLSREDCRAAARSALKAAMEASHD